MSPLMVQGIQGELLARVCAIGMRITRWGKWVELKDCWVEGSTGSVKLQICIGGRSCAGPVSSLSTCCEGVVVRATLASTAMLLS